MLAVCHNFQFSRAFTQLSSLMDQKKLGTITSFYCAHITNDLRRLPAWSEDLHGGLFYDESPHVFYLLRKYLGKGIQVKHVYATQPAKTKQTPHILDIQLSDGKIPATIYINFASPICEWYFMILGSQQAGVVDLFRDILTVFPNDGQHLTREVLTTSFVATTSHWQGVFRNGVDYLRHTLFWGIDEVQRRFYQAVTTRDKKYLAGISGDDGLAINKLQHFVLSAL